MATEVPRIPLSLKGKFFKYQKLYFQVVSLWPLSERANKYQYILYHVHFVHIFVFWTSIFITFMFIEFTRRLQDISRALDVLFILSTEIAMFTKFLAIKIQNKKYEYLSKVISENIFEQNSSEEVEIFKRNVKESTIVRNIYTGSCIVALLSFLVLPLLTGFKDLPIPSYYPLDLEIKANFLYAYTYQSIGITIHCLVNTLYDSLVASLLIYVRVQLEILGQRLKNIGKCANGRQELIEKDIRKCIYLHKKILELYEVVESLISLPFTVQMIISVIVICANFYVLASKSLSNDSMNIFLYSTYLVSMILQIYIICNYGNEVTLKSDELGFSLYDAEWFSWDKSNKQLMLIMLQRFRIPIRVKAVKFYSFNLATFLSILNSSYSYFALLRNVNQ